MAQMKNNTLSKNGSPIVSILTGSPSDLPVVNKAKDVLDELGIPSEVLAMSAHRTPDLVVNHVTGAKERGVEVIIACAGMAAHLAGVVAAHTTLPVIGVPLASGALRGMDALLATVQMPPGIPVATVGIDGSRNAAFLAARILGLGHPELIERIEARMAKDRARYEVSAPAKKKPAKKRSAKKTAKKTAKKPAKKASKKAAKKAAKKRPAKKRA